MPGPPPSALRIALLGGFHVTVGGAPVAAAAWRLRTARSLIKLLALSAEHSLHREQVVQALWPDRAPDTISNTLRQTLFVARRALETGNGGATVALRHELLSLQAEAVEVDVESFEAAATLAERAPSVERHRAALALYAGELLPEDRFEGWASVRREALRERHVGLLVDLAALCQQHGDLAAAGAALQQALGDDACHEHAHRELMRIFALTGRRQRALAQFHLLRVTLRRDFEDEPDPETRRLYQDILTRRLEATSTPEPVPAVRRGRPAPGPRDNLPLALTSFVGRELALREVVGLVARHRLVTLSGPGGCGKTRLALEAAAVLRREIRDGVWLVELAGLSDAASVPHAVAAVLGAESRSARPSEAAVAAHIGERDVLLVLDNCEHLVDACARLAAHLLKLCPNLRLLTTSREPLHLGGEANWRVPSLSSDEAQRLFSERAALASARYVPGPDSAAAVAEICQRVDGIPLAIELAAARIGVLAPAQIAERLRESLSVLTADRRAALTRQQTLRATLDWSYQLLDDEERVLFAALGVFAGDCDLDAVERICEGDLELLSRLVDKSLVVVAERDSAARYRLLDTIAHYARERLAQAGETARMEDRHGRYYLAMVEELAPALEQGLGRERLEREVNELRLALRNTLRSDAHFALRLAAASWRFWHDRGDRTEGARWLEDALRASPPKSAWRAGALQGLSVLAARTSDHERSLASATEAVELLRAGKDRGSLAEALHHLGTLAWIFADYPAALRWCDESLAVARTTDPAIAASVAHTLGVIAASRNDLARGRELVAQSVEELRRLPRSGPTLLLPVALGFGRYPGAVSGRLFLDQTFVTARRVTPALAVAYALNDSAVVARNAGEAALAHAQLDESLAIFRRHRDELGAAQAMGLLGILTVNEGEHELARELLEESLAIRTAANDVRGIGVARLALSAAAAQAGDAERAWAQAQQALELFERTDDGPGRSAVTMQLGYLAADAGRLVQARELQQLSLARWREFIPYTPWCACSLIELARIDRAVGEPARAVQALETASEICRHNDDRLTLEQCREAIDAVGNDALTGG
jgi:predicted ATPase/DNA-binding SARP family transcriptional activator